MKQTVRLGCGSAYAEDDLEPAVDLAEKGNLDYLCFDCLAERTLSMAQLRKKENPQLGYDLRLEQLIRTFVPFVSKNQLKVIGNMGAANPNAAVKRAAEICRELNINDVVFASITGDDISNKIESLNPILWETGEPLSYLKGKMISANVYLGAEAIVEALKKGANFIIGGRLADPSLFLAPLIHEFQWPVNEWNKLGKGTLIGHLLECGTHVTGGNFADPPYRIVPGLDHLGLPIAEVDALGDGVITKLPDAGGIVTEDTLKAQMIYEVHNPENYQTPDVACNMRHAKVKEVSKDRVHFSGATGQKRSNQLKVLVGVLEGYIGEGEISFAGPGASERAQLGRDILEQRIRRKYSGAIDELRIDIIGWDSIHENVTHLPNEPLHDVRLRVACRTQDKKVAEGVGKEAEWQFFGPSGGGGVRKNVREVLAMYSTFVPREACPWHVQLEVVQDGSAQRSGIQSLRG